MQCACAEELRDPISDRVYHRYQGNAVVVFMPLQPKFNLGGHGADTMSSSKLML